jgi:hypothetical protein
MRANDQGAAQGVYPEIRQLVLEASQALARLDAARLEELALSCKALNRGLHRDLHPDLAHDQILDTDREMATEPVKTPVAARRAELARQARQAQGDMAVFARILDGTRTNLNVLNRLREQRAGRLEYSVPSVPVGRAWPTSEPGHGDN